MCKLISILILKDVNVPENLNPEVNYLREELSKLNYTVQKISTIEGFNSENIAIDVESSLKSNDFVILIDRTKSPNDTLASICNVFNTELISSPKMKLKDVSIPKLTTILDYENSVQLTPVIYLGRLFVVWERNLKLVFKNILKSYLQAFNRESNYVKRLYFKDCDIEGNRNCGCSQNYVVEKHENLTVVELKSSDLMSLVNDLKVLKEKYQWRLIKEVHLSKCIYDKNCFYRIQKAIECVESCLEEYSPENVFLSFNGGKDCTVLLHLVLGVLTQRYPNYTQRLSCMYIQSKKPFLEVNSFIDLLRHYYNLEIITITKNIKDGLEMFLNDRPNMKACLMGTRRSDPYSHDLKTNQMTDRSWPQVMRVSPLLDWNYCEIWDYLLYFQVPYCVLYDEGYTSLGSVDNTIRNPALLYQTDDKNEVYLPAYKLLDGNREREGRV